MKKGGSSNTNPPPAKPATAATKGAKAVPDKKPFNPDDFVSVTLPRE